jgi:hypothetical protein
MARKVVQKTSFLGGEAGPLLEGRSDLAQFQLGVSPGQNFIALKGGGVTRRPGTRYVKATEGNKPARLFPIVTSLDSSATIYLMEIAVASSTTLTFRAIKVSDGSVTGAGTWTVLTGNFDSTTGAGLEEIQMAQSGLDFFFTHKGFAPIIITCSPGGGPLAQIEYTARVTASRALWFAVPYRTANISTTTLSIDVETVGTGRVVTASSAIFVDSSVVGSWYRMKTSGGSDGWFKITGWTDTTHVTVQVYSAISAAASATTDWSESAWSDYRGWPRTITFYGQRLVFGGNSHQPDTFWMSQVGDNLQMSASTSGIDDPLQFTLASSRLNQIRWMDGGKKLTIATSSSEWVGTVSNDGTNLFVEFNEETTHGSSTAKGVKVDNGLIFAQRSERTIRELSFNFDNDAYEGTDLNLFGSHVGTAYGRFESTSGVGIAELAYQGSGSDVIWARDNYGRFFGITRDKKQQIASWHSHTVGGKVTDSLFTGGSGDDYPALVKSICVVPESTGKRDRVWMVVRRAINGGNIYSVEYMDDIKVHPYLTCGTSGDIKAFLDCASFATAASTVTWSGYAGSTSGKPDLRNESVYVVAEDTNGAIVHSGLLTVSNTGVITLPTAATSIAVGHHSDAILRLLPIEGGDAPDVKMRSAKRVDVAAVRLHQTWGLRVGKNRIQRISGNEDNTTFEPISFNLKDLPTIATFTGTKEIPIPTDADTDGSFALAMQEPWPCTILSISSRVVSNEV